MVQITNKTGHKIVIIAPEVNFRRELNSGMSMKIDKETLEQLMFRYGFASLVKEGSLYIEDLGVKKELGLEPEDAIEPVNIIVLNDKQRRQYMTILSFDDFKKSVAKLSQEQIQELADYAIVNKLLDYEKCEYLKKICGRDIITTVRLST